MDQLFQPHTTIQAHTIRLEHNLKCFQRFRLLYAARFYYPVFTVLFLDYGLTLEQFAILNMVWAITIVIAEVPSGALADLLGPKKLLVWAAGLMVVEMALIACVPIGPSPYLFAVFLANRICSGLSEAAASGADEALAYDSLKALGREQAWAQLLEKTARLVSIGFCITMIIGALAYDAELINRLLHWLNGDWSVPSHWVIRLPVVLTLITALMVFINNLGFRDMNLSPAEKIKPLKNKSMAADWLGNLGRAYQQILQGAQWVFHQQVLLFIILAALALDSVARQFVVLASEYYRIIDIPIAWFGLIGAGMSLLGIGVAKLANVLVARYALLTNFIILSGLLLVSLLGLAMAIPYMGLVFVLGTFAIIGLVQFHSSYYINQLVDSRLRATVLSFRGLALNLGLAFASFLYTGLVAYLKSNPTNAVAGPLKDQIFIHALYAFPLYYGLLFLLISLLALCWVREKGIFSQVPPGL